MPGINLLVGNAGGEETLEALLLAAQETILPLPDYRSETLFSSDRFCAGVTRYPAYPVRVIESGETLIIFEGRIYSKSTPEVESDLIRLAGVLARGEENAGETLGQWLRSVDGDFIAVVWDRTRQRLFLFNDALGRLPVYYSRNGNLAAVSRRAAFCVHFTGQPAADRRGLAETLLLGFPLGKRTLVEGVSRLSPGTLLTVEGDKPEISRQPVCSFNFDRKDQTGKTYERMAGELEDLFLNACRARAGEGDGQAAVVALSGGLDSRAVAAGLKKTGVKAVGATFLDFAREREPDATLAGRIADALEMPWRLFDLKKPDGDDCLLMIALKDGLCSTGMSFILDFFRQIKETYGPDLIHFTGDEGNILLPDMRPPQKLRAIDDLVDCIISNNAWLTLEQVRELTGFEPEEMRGEIRRRVEGYPEKDLSQKYIHFIIFEHCFKLQFEGEEKSRSYFWTVAPYYSLFVFDYLMNVPDDRKRYHRLYDHFLRRLSPEIAGIDNVGSLAVPLHSPRRYLYLKARELFSLLPASLKIRIRARARKPYVSKKIDESIRRRALETLSGSRLPARYLDPAATRALLGGSLDKAQFDILTTIILYLDSLETAPAAS